VTPCPDVIACALAWQGFLAIMENFNMERLALVAGATAEV